MIMIDIESMENIDRVNSLVEDIFGEEDFEKQLEIAGELLEIDPENPVGVYVKWQAMDEEESDENIGLLEKAAEDMLGSDDIEDEILRSVCSSMLSDLASHHYFKGDKERALAVARDFMEIDRDCYLIGRLVYYACLIEAGANRANRAKNAENSDFFAEAIDSADSDICETPIGAYARAIALFESEGATEEASDALLEAISMDPDMVFYILGLWTLGDEDEESDEISEEMEDFLLHIAVLAELWGATEERLAFLGVAAFAFGYMTGRMESTGDIDMLEDGYESLGCLEEMREARDTIHALIASGKEPEVVDEEALMMFRELRDKGIFS